jgi:opacity protein-like surface antigen
MKTVRFLFFGILVMAALPSLAWAHKLKAGASLNYYMLNNSIFKETYGRGDLMFGASLGYEVIRKLELRAEISFFQPKGKMTLTKESIKLSILPVIAGVRFRFMDAGRWSPYVGGGAGSYSYKETLPERFGDVSGSTSGIHFEAGSYLRLSDLVFLDINARYILAKDKPFSETVKLGGIRFGVGAGFQF